MRIIIAGGGTGGHLFPGIAIAREFQKRDPNIKILFVGTRQGIESKILPKEKFDLRTILSGGLQGKFCWQTIVAVGKAPIGLLQSLWIIIKSKPNIVIGVGGYATGPFLLMAWFLRVPAVIQEQNLVPGITNRILGRLVDKIFISFDESKSYFPEKKVELTGNPINEEYFKKKPSKRKSLFNILVFGGSRGAHSINRAMIEALDHLVNEKTAMHFIHQTGQDQLKKVQEKYHEKKMPAEVSSFIFNMEDSYRRSHLVVCRAGATTIAELTAIGRAAILIPYPFASDNHQELNAQVLVKEGAAVMLKDSEMTGEKLAELIKKLMSNPDKLMEMEKASLRLAKKEAGKRIVNECYSLLSG